MRLLCVGLLGRSRGFNSRTPCGVRPSVSCPAPQSRSFNSRTPCGVRHPDAPHSTLASTRFNSRTPCGVRQLEGGVYRELAKFQFTHPVRGATSERMLSMILTIVSIHAPRAGCDLTAFISRLNVRVSIHAPRAGCDCRRGRLAWVVPRFNSRTPCGVRLDGVHLSP